MPFPQDMDTLVVSAMRSPFARSIGRIYLGLLGALDSLRRSLMPTQLACLEATMSSYVAQAAAVVAELGIADHLRDGPQTAEQLAAKVGVAADPLMRVMRLLAAKGLLKRKSDGRFALGRHGRGLVKSDPASFAAFARYTGAKPSWMAWSELLTSVRTETAAFTAAHGAEFFDYTRQDPVFGSLFDQAMTGFATQQIPLFVGAMRFPADAVVCDVGGGRGALLGGILAANPGTRGVVYDLPEVVAGVPPELRAKLEVVGGSFFDSVPAGHDYYVLKNVLHDWGDPECGRILGNVARAMPAHGRLVVAELVLEENAPRYPIAPLLDVAMLVLTRGGRERTMAEYEKLFAASGFVLEREETKIEFLSVLVARKA